MNVDLVHQVPELWVRVQGVHHGVHEFQAQMAGQKTVISLEEIHRYSVGDHDGIVVNAAMVEHHHADTKESHQHVG